MTGTGFTVQTDALQTNGSQYQAVADKVRIAHQTLMDALNSVGACWGNDDVGKQIVKSYVTPAMNALQALDQVDGGVQSMAQATQTWAKNFQSVQSV